MNRERYLQGEQWVAEEDPHQPRIREVLSPAEQGGGDQVSVAVRAAHCHVDGFSWGLDAEIVAHLHVKEGRNVEALGAMLLHCAGVAADGDDITVTLPEGIVHLINQGFECAILAVAEIDAERIEGVAEETRHGEEQDFAACKMKPGGSELGIDLCAKRLLLPRTVIGVMHAEKIEAVIGEKPEVAVEARAARRDRARANRCDRRGDDVAAGNDGGLHAPRKERKPES